MSKKRKMCKVLIVYETEEIDVSELQNDDKESMMKRQRLGLYLSDKFPKKSGWIQSFSTVSQDFIENVEWMVNVCQNNKETEIVKEVLRSLNRFKDEWYGEE